MVKKNLVCFLLIVLVLPLVSALDQETILTCGGDNETIILCLGDEQHAFIGTEFPSGGGQQPGSGPDSTESKPDRPEPEPEIEVEEPIIIFSIDFSFLKGLGFGPEDKVLIVILFCIFILCIILILRKRKCDKCKKRFKNRDLNKKGKEILCDKCLKNG